MPSEMLNKEESYHIIGACFEVYREMGPDFLEAVYQECLAHEFEMRGILYQERVRTKLNYKSAPLNKYYDADFLCFEKKVCEIKAHSCLSDIDRSRAIHYVKSSKIELGLLVNFEHHPKIGYERYLNQWRMIISRVSRIS